MYKGCKNVEIVHILSHLPSIDPVEHMIPKFLTRMHFQQITSNDGLAFQIANSSSCLFIALDLCLDIYSS